MVVPENEISSHDIFTECMQNKPVFSLKNKKLICYWTDKKNYLIHYRM